MRASINQQQGFGPVCKRGSKTARWIRPNTTRAKVQSAEAKMKAWVEEKKTATSEKIAAWKAQDDVKKLAAYADSAEDYAVAWSMKLSGLRLRLLSPVWMLMQNRTRPRRAAEHVVPRMGRS